MDELLFKSKGTTPKVFWRPGNERSIICESDPYKQVDKVVRTVHVEDAIHICWKREMRPKPILTPSILNSYYLRQSNHPCKRLHVLWFGAQIGQPSSSRDSEEHDWYGNVQFAIEPNRLLCHWKYCYLVEMMTARTHTATRLLITNTDYSQVLPVYDPHKKGGPWYIDSEGNQFVLSNCSRFNDEGYNRNGHSVEFMIEVTSIGKRAILDECIISFRNHSRGRDLTLPVRCHRSLTSRQLCPTPFTAEFASRKFFDEHRRIASVSFVATPKLSETAEYYRRCYFMNTHNAPPPSHPFHSNSQQMMTVEGLKPHHIPRGLQFQAPQFQTPMPTHLLKHFSAEFIQQSGNFTNYFRHTNLQVVQGNSRNCWGLQENTNYPPWFTWGSGRGSWGEVQEQHRLQQPNFSVMSGRASWGQIQEQQRLQQANFGAMSLGNYSGRTQWEQRGERSRKKNEERLRKQQDIAETPMAPTDLMLAQWWSSIGEYTRSILLWFFEQEKQQAVYIPGWPTPQQHHWRNR